MKIFYGLVIFIFTAISSKGQSSIIDLLEENWVTISGKKQITHLSKKHIQINIGNSIYKGTPSYWSGKKSSLVINTSSMIIKYKLLKYKWEENRLKGKFIVEIDGSITKRWLYIEKERDWLEKMGFKR